MGQTLPLAEAVQPAREGLAREELSNPVDCSTPGFPVLHQLLELAQTHVHQISDAIQSSYPLLPTSPPARNLFQHQGLFK